MENVKLIKSKKKVNSNDKQQGELIQNITLLQKLN